MCFVVVGGPFCRAKHTKAEAQLKRWTLLPLGGRKAEAQPVSLPLLPLRLLVALLGGKSATRQNSPLGISRMKLYLWTALLVLLGAEEAEALREPQLCYVLDGILFVYGIILTFLYCRLKIQNRKKAKMDSMAIYEGLGIRASEPYATLELPKIDPQNRPHKIDPQAQAPPEEGSLVG
ncbi:high affinity immunoglobulin epsilon receptor subunit gamma isoform X2 [Rhineura floridana]|uniref:high affinity immunoglobulin epsilon receptor subunit gamma isoform X2 n=1 Tax=Rhineura floridana TaxID=261503 RepID=UPI002AC82CE4|nr:high affinity immunoglobulin epsilon receptor subunit gamma isoform X2 [Rhineura floridana]